MSNSRLIVEEHTVAILVVVVMTPATRQQHLKHHHTSPMNLRVVGWRRRGELLRSEVCIENSSHLAFYATTKPTLASDHRGLSNLVIVKLNPRRFRCLSTPRGSLHSPCLLLISPDSSYLTHRVGQYQHVFGMPSCRSADLTPVGLHTLRASSLAQWKEEPELWVIL